jgi:hypothetical protein
MLIARLLLVLSLTSTLHLVNARTCVKPVGASEFCFAKDDMYLTPSDERVLGMLLLMLSLMVLFC